MLEQNRGEKAEDLSINKGKESALYQRRPQLVTVLTKATEFDVSLKLREKDVAG